MYRDVVWLVSFALTIVAITFGMKVMAPQLQNKQEIRYEPPPVETKP